MKSRSGSTCHCRVGGSRPHHSDDVEVAERHDGGRHDEDVGGQEHEVEFALPLGRVSARPARQHRATAAAAAVRRRLDEDEELRQSEDERHQPRRDHLEPDRRLAGPYRPQWLHQHLRTVQPAYNQSGISIRDLLVIRRCKHTTI